MKNENKYMKNHIFWKLNDVQGQNREMTYRDVQGQNKEKLGFIQLFMTTNLRYVIKSFKNHKMYR